MPIPENNCVEFDPCYESPFMGEVGQVINLYVNNNPQTAQERQAFFDLAKALPPPMKHGVRVRLWEQWYPEAPYPGLTVGMRDVTVTASNELLIPYDDFVMANVPWDKLGGSNDCC